MSPPLTIFHLVSLMGIGGRCATALRQMRLLSKRGHNVLLGCLPNSTAAQRGRELGLTVFDDFEFKRGFRPSVFYSDCRKLASRCDAGGVQIVHAHLSQESWVACLGVKLAKKKPKVVRSRGVVVPVAAHLFNRWQHNTLTDLLLTPSDVIHRQIVALPGFKSERVRLIPDGVDIERFNPAADGTSVRAEFGIPADAPLVVMIARLEPVKGHTVFFRALKELKDRNAVQGLRALCACDERTAGVFDKTVREAKEQFGLEAPFLQFTGMRSDPERVIAAADVIALPSLGSEGSSRVALEAAACAVPIVASDAGCLPDVVLHGKTGLVVARGQHAPLSAALEELLNDRSRANELGRAARARAEAEYSEQAMADRLEEAYRQILK